LHGWSGKSISERAKEAKLDLNYDTLYAIICAYKHNCPSAASGLILDGGAGVDFVVGPSIKGVYWAAVNAIELFLDLCGIFQDVFNLGLEPDVREYQQDLQAATTTVLASCPALCT
jgi:hypothetical protein